MRLGAYPCCINSTQHNVTGCYAECPGTLNLTPEPTRVKHLSGAPLVGRPLALPTDIRLGWKGLPWTNTSLLRKSVNYGRKKFYRISPSLQRSIGSFRLIYTGEIHVKLVGFKEENKNILFS